MSRKIKKESKSTPTVSFPTYRRLYFPPPSVSDGSGGKVKTTISRKRNGRARFKLFFDSPAHRNNDFLIIFSCSPPLLDRKLKIAARKISTLERLKLLDKAFKPLS